MFNKSALSVPKTGHLLSAKTHSKRANGYPLEVLEKWMNKIEC